MITPVIQVQKNNKTRNFINQNLTYDGFYRKTHHVYSSCNFVRNNNGGQLIVDTRMTQWFSKNLAYSTKERQYEWNFRTQNQMNIPGFPIAEKNRIYIRMYLIEKILGNKNNFFV